MKVMEDSTGYLIELQSSEGCGALWKFSQFDSEGYMGFLCRMEDSTFIGGLNILDRIKL